MDAGSATLWSPFVIDTPTSSRPAERGPLHPPVTTRCTAATGGRNLGRPAGGPQRALGPGARDLASPFITADLMASVISI